MDSRTVAVVFVLLLLAALATFLVQRGYFRKRAIQPKQIAPDAPNPVQNIQQLLENRQYAEALQALREVDEENPRAQHIIWETTLLVRLMLGEMRSVGDELARRLAETGLSPIGLMLGLETARLLDDPELELKVLQAMANSGAAPVYLNCLFAVYYKRINDEARALKYGSLCQGLKPRSPEHWQTVALGLSLNNRHSHALEVLEANPAHGPDSKPPFSDLALAEHHTLKAWALYNLDRLEAAETEARAALRHFEHHTRAHYALFRILARLGNRSGASEHLQRAAILGHRLAKQAQLGSW